MRTLLTILLLLPGIASSQDGIFALAEEISRQQSSTVSGLAPPLDSNSNPELILADASSFADDDVAAINGFPAPGWTNTTGITAVTSTNGFEGNNSAQWTTASASQTKLYDTGVTLAADEVVEWGIVIQGTNGEQFRIRRVIGSTTLNTTQTLDGTVQVFTGSDSEPTGGNYSLGVFKFTAGTMTFDMTSKRQ